MSDTNDFAPAATGRGLEAFLDFAIAKGYLKRATGGAMKTAVREVLSATEGDAWEDVEVDALDEADTLRRFETLRAMKFNQASLATYKSRFSKAVKMFADFRKNPSSSSWHSEVRTRQRSATKKPGITTPEPPTPAPPAGPWHEPAHTPKANVIKYPFPIRDGVLAGIELPSDLTKREAKRLCAFIDSLAFDEVAALPPGPSE